MFFAKFVSWTLIAVFGFMRELQTKKGKEVQTKKGKELQTKKGKELQTKKGMELQTMKGKELQTKKGKELQTIIQRAQTDSLSHHTDAHVSSYCYFNCVMLEYKAYPEWYNHNR